MEHREMGQSVDHWEMEHPIDHWKMGHPMQHQETKGPLYHQEVGHLMDNPPLSSLRPKGTQLKLHPMDPMEGHAMEPNLLRR